MNKPVQQGEQLVQDQKRRPLAYALIAAIVVMAGALLTVWQVRTADHRMRDMLIEENNLLAGTLEPEYITRLQGGEHDLTTPTYLRLKQQLQTAHTLLPFSRFLYLMRVDAEGRVIFLVDSEPVDSEDYSPPGQIYAEATDVLRNVFQTRRPTTEGPEEDRWGIWMSSFVPIIHPNTDQTIAVLGIDVDAQSWRAHLIRYAIPPLLFTMVMLALTVVLIALHMRSSRRDSTGERTRSIEIAAIAITGVLITGLTAYLSHTNEQWARQAAFRRIATNQAHHFQSSLIRVGDSYLEGIARFFDGSNFVDHREYHDYVEYLLDKSFAASWQWTPTVPDNELDSFERAVAEQRPGGYTIWAAGETARRIRPENRSTHFPICYIEPEESNRAALGFDMSSIPELLEAIEEAENTDLVSASLPLDLPAWSPQHSLILVFRPVFNRDGSGRMSGLASATILMDKMLESVTSRDNVSQAPLIDAAVYLIRDSRTPQHICSSKPGIVMPSPTVGPTLPGLARLSSLTAPAFALGKCFAFIAKPAEGFERAYPVRSGFWTALIGLILTALVTVMLRMVSSQRSKLEREVRIRTAELEQSAESYRNLFSSIQQAIYILDRDMNYVDVNEGAVAMYGYRREEFVGKNPGFISAPGKNDHLDLPGLFARAWAGEPLQLEFWGQRKNGEIFPKDVWLYKGTYFGKEAVIAFANDITERKRIENEHERLTNQLTHAQKMESVGRLAGGVAHDFNNMLQAILGNTILAKQQVEPGSTVYGYLEEVEQSAQRSAALTRQLLAFASKQTIQPRIVDLNAAVGTTMNMLRRLIGEDIQLVWKPEGNLWPVKVDTGQIDQILANLVINARDAIATSGIITIETHRHSCQGHNCGLHCVNCRAGDYVVLKVTDNGCGMDAEAREHLFEPFYTTKGPGKGTGLGLPTVFGIVKQNDGQISVDSESGRGTAISILFPRQQEQISKEPMTAAAASEMTQSGSETILIVEDEEALLRMGRVALSRLGYHVLAAASPAEALDMISRYEGRIHLLITDVILPGMNGRELAMQVVSMKQDVACLFMSGYTADVITDRGILDAEVNFIQKPFTITDLAGKVREILDRNAGRADG